MPKRRTLVFSLLLAACLPAQSFREEAAACGLGGLAAKRVAWADFDGDGWPDLLADGTRVFLSRPAEKGGGRSFAEVPGAIPAVIAAWAPTCIPGDVDGDGDLDIYCGVNCDFVRPKVENSRPVLDAEGRPVPAMPDDGRRSCILLGDGKGRFSRLEKSGVEEPPMTLIAAAFLDFDRDGVLDLFAGTSYVNYGASLECHPDRLYRGLGGGRFAEVTAGAGLLTEREPGGPRSSRPTYGVATADWNGDGWTDLLVCTYGRQWNRLWRNNGDGTFTDVGPETGWDGDEIRHGRYPAAARRRPEPPFRSNGNTFDVAVGDIDNDGDLDLFSAEITHGWAGEASDLSMFLVNLGRQKGWTFQRRPDLVPPRPRAPAWNQGDLHSALFDADNDGWLDLAIASSDYPDDQLLRLYRNLEGKGFREATAEAGFRWRSPAGISLADFDRDGRLDLVCGRSHMRLTKEQRQESPMAVGLWRNRGEGGGHWLGLRLRGRGKGGANSQAIGARVQAKAGGRTWLREVQGAAGHAGHWNDTAVHLGLGKTGRLEELTILWPDAKGTRTVLRDVAVDRFLEVVEPAAAGTGGEGAGR